MNLIHSAGMRALPPFDGLIAFDAALRHRSMTRAAGELGLTQSAISHRLRKLESFVGTRLLDRTAGGLLPPAAGVMDCAARPEPLSDILVGCVIVRILTLRVAGALSVPMESERAPDFYFDAFS